MAEASSGPKERKDSESSVVFIFFLKNYFNTVEKKEKYIYTYTLLGFFGLL